MKRSNLKADGALSLAIGGATGAFVGTDVSFGDSNWLRPIVGIEEGVANIPGAITVCFWLVANAANAFCAVPAGLLT